MPKKFVTRKKDVPVATPGSSTDSGSSSADSSPGGSQTRDVEWPPLTKADLEQFEKKFTALDVNGDGTLDAKELVDVLRDHNAAMSKLYGRELVDDELGDIWDLADEDGSGDIDPKEFVLMMYLIRCTSDGIFIPKSRKEFPPGQFPPMAEESPEKEPKEALEEKEPEKEEPEDTSSAPDPYDSASAELARLKKAHAALTTKLDAVTESAAEAEVEHLESSRLTKSLQKRAEKAEASLETLAKKLDKAEDRAEASEAEAKVLQRRFDASETARKDAEAAKKEAVAEAAEAKRDAHNATAAMASKGNEQTKMLTERAEQAEANEEKARRAQVRAEADSKAATARAEAAEAARAEAEAAAAAAAERAKEAELDARVREESAENANQDAEVEIKKRRLAESARDVAALRATAADERADKAEAAAAAAARAEDAATTRALAALAAMRRVAQLAGDKLAQRELIRGAAAEEEDERVDESRALAREELFSLPPPAPEDAGADVEDALAATVRAFQAHLVDVVEERKRLRDTFGASLGSSHQPTPSPGAGKSPKAPRALDAWGDPPSRSSDPEELRAELERTRRYAARLQRKREEAVRGALESENAAARAKEERDELAREERARADAAERDLDAAVEKFRVLRAETTRLREDAENLRMVNRALSRELYGGGASLQSSSREPPPATPSRGDLRREFESGGDELHAANAFLRESGVAAAAMEGVGALEGSAARLGGRRRETADAARRREEAATDAFPEREADGVSAIDEHGGDEHGGGGETRGSGSLPPAPSRAPNAEAEAEAASGFASVATRARAFHPAEPEPEPHVSASQALASAAKQAKEATSTAAAAMAASAAASASSLRFAESRRDAARGDAFSHFPGPKMRKGSEWLPIGGALTSSGTVHVRSVAVLRQTHPGGTFGPPRQLFGDENKATKPNDPRVAGPPWAPPRSAVSGDAAPDWFLDARFAYDERVAEARAATAARLEAAEAREAAKLRATAWQGARLPARLRPREDAPTAEDVDKAVKRFVRLFAEHGVAVRLTRQAPFKYVLEQAGIPARGRKKMLMLRLEQSRLVVHRGGASRGAGAAAARAPAADLVEEIAGFAARAPLSSRKEAPVSSAGSSPAGSRSPAPAPDPLGPPRRAPGLGKDKAWLESAKRTGGLASRDPESASARARASRGATTVASDGTFVPAPDAPEPTPPRKKVSPGAGPGDKRFESSAERRTLEKAFAASGGASGASAAKALPTGPRPFLRDDAPGASPARVAAPAPAAEKPKAKPESLATAAPEPAAAGSAPALAPVPRAKPNPRRSRAEDDDWDLP